MEVQSMFERRSAPWKCRHGNSDKEQLLLYVCKVAIAIDKHVCFMASRFMDSRTVSTPQMPQYSIYEFVNSLICTMVVVDFGYILFFTSTEKSWLYRAQLLGTIYTKNTLIILSFFLLVKIKGTFCMFNLMIFDNNPI